MLHLHYNRKYSLKKIDFIYIYNELNNEKALKLSTNQILSLSILKKTLFHNYYNQTITKITWKIQWY